jgi:hypothetical protein
MTGHDAYGAGPDEAATRARQAERQGLWRILAISLAAALAALALTWWWFFG